MGRCDRGVPVFSFYQFSRRNIYRRQSEAAVAHWTVNTQPHYHSPSKNLQNKYTAHTPLIFFPKSTSSSSSSSSSLFLNGKVYYTTSRITSFTKQKGKGDENTVGILEENLIIFNKPRVCVCSFVEFMLLPCCSTSLSHMQSNLGKFLYVTKFVLSRSSTIYTLVLSYSNILCRILPPRVLHTVYDLLSIFRSKWHPSVKRCECINFCYQNI